MEGQTLAALVLTVVIVSAIASRTGIRNFAFFFLALQSTFYVPIPLLADYSQPYQVEFVLLHMWFYFILTVTSLFLAPGRRTSGTEQNVFQTDCNLTWWINASIFLVGIAVTLAYYIAAGGLIYQKLGGGSITGAARLSYYAAGEYLYPGYVNQFKNVLLPMAGALVILHLRKPFRRGALAIFLLVLVVVLTGTGQREPLVFAALGLLAFAFKYWPTSGYIRAGVSLLITVQIFGIVSVLIGRAEGYSGIAALAAVIERALVVNQQANLETYYYVAERGFVWGQDWYQSLRSLAPSVKPHTLPRELFALLWGSRESGNSPESLVSSLYYNFGPVGIVVGPLILAIWVASLERRSRVPGRSPTRLMIGAFITIVLGFWTSTTILAPVNNGLATCLIYSVLARLRTRTDSSRVWTQGFRVGTHGV